MCISSTHHHTPPLSTCCRRTWKRCRDASSGVRQAAELGGQKLRRPQPGGSARLASSMELWEWAGSCRWRWREAKQLAMAVGRLQWAGWRRVSLACNDRPCARTCTVSFSATFVIAQAYQAIQLNKQRLQDKWAGNQGFPSCNLRFLYARLETRVCSRFQPGFHPGKLRIYGRGASLLQPC